MEIDSMLNSQTQPKLQFRHDKFPFTHSFHSQKRPKRRAEAQSTKTHMTVVCVYQTPAFSNNADLTAKRPSPHPQ